jgi:hypothetical protein
MATEPSQTPEQRAISKNLSQLCKGVTYVSALTAFAMALEEKDFITSECNSNVLNTSDISEEKKCRHFLEAVQQQIRMDPTKFDLFVSIFSSEGALEPYAECMINTRGKEHS